jgi:solute carrier family 25 phosphate transporter 23/24/25/41
LLERRNDRCASTASKERTQEHTVGYAEFKKYAALLPSAQLRDNAAWNWLAAATGPERSAEQTPPRAQPAKQLFAGGLAGVAARTAVAPLDRARTIMQDLHPRASADGAAMKNGLAKAAKPIKPRARGLTGTCLKVLREEGVVGLWRGNAVTALKVVPCNALQFAIFHQMKDAFRRRRERREREARKNGDVASSSSSSSSSGLTLPERLASGSVAGAISTAVCYPLDTLKSQMAVRGGLKGSALRAARQMFAEQGGARAFYKGLGPTLVADIVGTGLGFTLYDSFNSWYQKNVTGGRKPSPAEKGVLGGLSACVCLTATQPLEVVMTRMRVQGVGGRPVLYKNMLDCLAVTARREGWRSLWLGTGAAYAKIFPQLAITYYVFEMASEQMGVGGLARYDAGKRTGKIVTP